MTVPGAASRGDDPCDLGLVEVAARLRDGALSSVALTEAALARAAQAQARTNCFIALEPDAALAAARRADQRLAEARGSGGDGGSRTSTPPLLGVPLAHKDMFHQAGRRPTYGSRVAGVEAPSDGRAPADRSPADRSPAGRSENATLIARLQAAGAHPIGTLNMAEFALGATGHNAAFGDCRNAWNPDHVSGGSSSGSGAAVACGATFASLGSDTGGSVRIPASANGVLGLKPTYGLLPRTGSMKLAPSIDVLGPITRSADDMACVLQAIAGADGRDPLASRRPVPDYAAALRRGIEGLRLGIPRNHFFDVATAELRGAVERCVAALEGAGARVVEVDVPDVAAMSELSRAVVYSEATALHAPWLRARGDRYTPQVRVRASTGLGIPAPAYLAALQLRLPLLERFVGEVFSRCDALVSPTLPIPVPRRDETDVGSGEAMWAILAKLVHCTAPFNYLGLPAISVPAGLDARGLPMGVQYAARPFAEGTLLRIAAVQEHLLPMPRLPSAAFAQR
jgi:aspartyl-tRNA(Asn)/glutamyl-tRNA(Gln) amidotransferase subunit A